MRNANFRKPLRLGMLAVAFLLVCVAHAEVPIFVGHPRRVVGTNLFDFSPIQKARGTGSKFFIEGFVKHASSNLVVIDKRCLYYTLNWDRMPKFPTYSQPLNMAASDALLDLEAKYYKALADLVGMMQTNSNRLTVDQWLSVGSAFQPAFDSHLEQVDAIVTNWPSDLPVSSNKYARIFAVPTKTTTNSVFYDYGTPFQGSLQQFTQLFKVTPTGLIAERIPTVEEIAAKRRADLDKKVKWWEEQAAKGSAYSQFELGRILISGQAGITNKARGLELLRASAAQGYQSAVELLKASE